MTTRIDFGVLARLVLRLTGVILVVFGVVGLAGALVAALVVDDQFPDAGFTMLTTRSRTA